MRTLGRPNESDELRRLTQRVFNLERARGEARVARSGDKMTGRLYGPTGLDPISTDEYARKAYVDAQANTRMLVDAKGDLLVGTAPDILDRLPVGTNHQFLRPLDTEPSGVRWADFVEPWSGAALPTTDLRVGRMVRATAPANAVFAGYIFYYNGTRWRLLQGRRLSAVLGANLPVASGGTSGRLIPVDFGLAPCALDIQVHLYGAAWRTGASDAKAKVVLWQEESPTARTEREHVHISCGPLADSTGRPTGSVTHFTGRTGPGTIDADDAIKFSAEFVSDGGAVTFAGDFTCSWRLTVVVS